MTITVYCAHCHRPLARELRRARLPTETCIREPVMQRRTTPGGFTYQYSDGSGEMQCSTWVMEP